MSFLKNRFFIGALCVLLAVLIGFCVIPLTVSITNRKVEVVAARVSIPKGTQITSDMLHTQEMFSSDIPPGSSLVTGEVIGRYTTTDIHANDVIFQGKFTDEFPYDDEVLYNLEGDKYAVTITTSSLSSSVAGKIKPGDIVTVFYTLTLDSESEELKAEQPGELRYLQILSVTTSVGEDISAEAQMLDTAGDTPLPAVVTLLCNLEQAERLAAMESYAQIHLALAAKADTTKAHECIKTQDIYFVTRYPDNPEYQAYMDKYPDVNWEELGIER